MRKQIKFNDFAKDYGLHKEEYQRAFNTVMSSGWYILGNEVKEFENEFSSYLGIKHTIGVGNGLEALQISLMALGINEGDEIITSPMSAVATSLAIIAIGAIPVFVDTDNRGQIDADCVKKAITNKTKAVIPVDLYGAAPDHDRLREIASKHKLFIVEDAAQAIGSEYKKTKLGTFGDIGCFSFYPTKNLGAIGDGGAIVTNDKELAEKCCVIRNYGQVNKYKHDYYGMNSRLDELQAAILRKKLNRLNQQNQDRNKIASIYNFALLNTKKVQPLLEADPKHLLNYHLYVVITDYRDQLQKYLLDKGIPCLIHYPEIIPNQKFIKSIPHHCKKLDNAIRLTSKILSLPIHPYLTEFQAKTIAHHLRQFDSLVSVI